MTDDERGDASVPYRKDSIGGPVDARVEAVRTPFAAATQRSLAAAADQFTALARFGSEAADALPIEDRARATAERRKRHENIFVREGAIQFDQHGYNAVLDYLQVVQAIQAKAVLLGYNAALVQTVDITSVPGGYVGRFGGHDIYVAAS